MLKKVAVTGTLSSGKSSVCQFFKEFGAFSFDADKYVHQLLSKNKELGQKVKSLLGPEIMDYAGNIDRAKVAKIVFEDTALLHTLEELIHPLVYEAIDQAYEECASQKNVPLFVAEVPLLDEKHAKQFDAVVTVLSEESLCQNRFLQKKKASSEEWIQRASKQLSAKQKETFANFVIRNDGTLKELRQATYEIFLQLRSQ